MPGVAKIIRFYVVCNSLAR